MSRLCACRCVLNTIMRETLWLAVMLLGLFRNVNGCMSDSPKKCIFEESDTGAASKVKSPRNLECCHVTRRSRVQALETASGRNASDEEHLAFQKMHGFSTVDGYVEITKSLADMIKFIANEPSAGLYYVQQHTQSAVPNLINLTSNIEGKSRQVTLHAADSEDSIITVRSMKECGLPIASEMLKDLGHSLAVVSEYQPRSRFISRPSSSFRIGKTISWNPATWGGRNTSPEQDGEKNADSISNVFRSANARSP